MNEDATASAFGTVDGGPELIKWFGRVPGFHDAEVLDLHLKRSGKSKLSIHTRNMTSEIENGYYRLEKHAVVTFTMDRIFELEIEGFNHQNVIGGLSLKRVRSGENTGVYELQIEPVFGLSGVIRAQAVSVSYTPGKP
ncbi:immunity 50 family protein (plasmid) [Leisingera sp. S132]|uniref:immunity 50 family protein n=1 Tax=Leisingera sp. S132 TaxID=2867016 RepID=UPI0021A49E05|nr:immunity 50 family protein [Leisingera sp. S132]UWQ81548.1 immunity 50 family protein [Leisingera sp. S132]